MNDTLARGDGQEDAEINRRMLLRGLDRLAFYFETSDPHLRHEAHIVAKQNLSYVANGGK